MNFSKFYKLLFICVVFLNSNLFSQSITWGPTVPAGSASNVQVLHDSSSAFFEFTNNGTALTAASIEVQLGTGIEYIAGSLSYTTSGSATVTEASSTGDNDAVFTIGNLAAGESVSITFERQASCSSRTHKLAGNTFEDVAHVYEGPSEVTYSNNGAAPFTAVYDVIYGNIVLGTPSYAPTAYTSVGGTVTRSINVTNGSFGSIGEFWFDDDYPDGSVLLSNFKINGTDISANATDDSDIVRIHFDAAAIANIDGTAGTNGNGDNTFEKDEFFTLSYDITALDCGASSNLLSNLKGFYGSDENNECSPSGTTSTSISITNGTPSVSIATNTNPGIDFCLSTTHSATITNNATDADDFAKDIVFFMGLRSNYSPISTLANVTMWGSEHQNVKLFSNFTINGTAYTPDEIAGVHSTMVDYFPHDYFMTDPDASGSGLEDLDGDGYYDDLGPGESVTVGYDITLDPADGACGTGRYDYVKWEHIAMDVEWRNQCGANQPPIRKEFNYTNTIRNYLNSTFLEGPSDINDGDQFEVRINPHLHNTVNCNGESGNTGSDVTWTVKCVLPAGVSLQAGATTDTHHDTYNPSIWQSNDTVFYEINRYNRNWYTFPLEMDCSGWDGSKPIAFDFVTTYECGDCWVKDMHCETFLSVPHCPDPCKGVTTTDFTAHRTTQGWTDQTMATPVTLTPGTHGVDKLLPYDTVKFTVKGHISDTISDNLHLRVEYNPDFGGNILDYISGTVSLYDLDGAHGSTSYQFPITTTPTINDLGNDEYEWLFDLSTFITDIDPSYQLGEGLESDSFTVELLAVFNQNTGAQYYKVNTLRANFFMIGSTAEEISCDSYGAPLFYTGFTTSSGGATHTMSGCSERELYGYYTWQGSAGDVFPNEYRPVDRMDSMIMSLPDGVQFLGTTSQSGFIGTFNHTVRPNGDIVIYPNADYYPRDWSTTYYPRVDIHVKGTCELESGNHKGKIKFYRTTYNYHPDSDIHQSVYVHDTNDPNITYIKPNILATPLNQVQPGVTDTVKWDMQVCNSTAGLDVGYNWLILDNSASSGITVHSVLDASGNEITTTDFGSGKLFVPVGAVNGGDCTTVKIVANYTSCSPDDLLVELGWDCADYPVDASELTDCNSNNFVRVTPLEASIGATITPLTDTPSDPANPSAGNFGSNEINMCDEFPVEYTIISSDMASMFDINFDLLIPNAGNGLEYVPGSATIEVEGVDAANTPRSVDAAGETAFGSGTGAVWNIALSDLDATNFGAGSGLYGAGDNPLQNEVTIRWQMKTTCDLTSGTKLSVRSYGESTCGSNASGSGEVVRSSNLNVDGVTLPYTTSFTTSMSPDAVFDGCNDTKNISIEMLVSGGTTTSNDSTFVKLSPGLLYDGNFTCTTTDCPVYNSSSMVGEQQVLIFTYPAGVTNSTIGMTFDVTTDGAIMSCNNIDIEIENISEISGLSCSAGSCPSTKVVTGSSLLSTTIEKPDYQLNFAKITNPPGTDLYEYELEITNNGVDATENLEIDFYCVNLAMDGIDAASGVIHTITLAPMTGGTTATKIGTFTTPICDPLRGIAATITPTADSGFSNCYCAGTSNPIAMKHDILPVELVSFEAKVEDCQTELTWESATELNFDYYQVERSFGGTDYETLEWITGEGDDTYAATYNYTDTDVNYRGIVYYRLKMVDLDETFEYSEVKAVSYEGCNENKNEEVSIFPNPALPNSNLTIELPFWNEDYKSDQVQIIVSDVLGRKVKEITTTDFLNGRATFSSEGLGYGSYFIHVLDDNGYIVGNGKIIIQE